MENKKSKFAEIAGWYGVGAILLAYGLLSFDFFDSKNVLYQVLNLTGAVGIVIDALSQKNWQPAVLNIVWAVVALIVLVKIIL